MRHIYTLFHYLLIPFIILRLYIKSRRLPAYRFRIGERFCLNRKNTLPVDIWLHAVSLGEAVAATPLIDALLAKKWKVLVTTMTPTGSQHVSKRFGDKVVHQYIPYDLPFCLRRFFKNYNPRVGVIMETEIWPNVINQAKQKNMPLFIVNARLSDKSFKSYERFKFMFKPVLNQLTEILAQSEEDAKRFVAIGASKDIVDVLGNMKFDIQLNVSPNKDCEQLKEKWGSARPVLIAASTHNDEEEQLLSRLDKLKTAIPNLLLIVVPRHSERFQEVYGLSQSFEFKTGLRSQPEMIDSTTDVVVIDSMGELLNFYKVSDYAFVGGSLVPIGGHNVLEPIAVKVPVFCGPFMTNSKAICRDLCAAGAMVMGKDADEVVAAIIGMYQDDEERQRQVMNASGVLAANRGVVERYMERIESVI